MANHSGQSLAYVRASTSVCVCVCEGLYGAVQPGVQAQLAACVRGNESSFGSPCAVQATPAVATLAKARFRLG